MLLGHGYVCKCERMVEIYLKDILIDRYLGRIVLSLGLYCKGVSIDGFLIGIRSMYTGMLVEVVFIETVPNKTSTNILIYILLSILLRLTGTRDRLIGCIEKESILGKDISTCLPVSLNYT